MAALNCAELLSTPDADPSPITMSPFFSTGSGKFDIPCERMQSVNFTALAMPACIMAGLIEPKCVFSSHVLAAELNPGKFLTAAGTLNPTPLCCPLSFTVGSGKFWIPRERMHFA